MKHGIVGKWLSIANFDSPVSQAILCVWQVFVNGALLWFAAIPYLAFDLMVGWQPSHGAIWLGCAAAFPLLPALTGLMSVSADMAEQRGYVGATVRRFIAAIVKAPRGIKKLWALCFAAMVCMAYDIALFPGAAGMSISAVVVFAIMILVLIAVSILDRREGHASLRGTVTYAVACLVRKPYLPLVWCFVLALAIAISFLPIVGSCWLVFAPGVCGIVIAVVNWSTGFDAAAAKEG